MARRCACFMVCSSELHLRDVGLGRECRVSARRSSAGAAVDRRCNLWRVVGGAAASRRLPGIGFTARRRAPSYGSSPASAGAAAPRGAVRYRLGATTEAAELVVVGGAGAEPRADPFGRGAGTTDTAGGTSAVPVGREPRTWSCSGAPTRSARTPIKIPTARSPARCRRDRARRKRHACGLRAAGRVLTIVSRAASRTSGGRSEDGSAPLARARAPPPSPTGSR